MEDNSGMTMKVNRVVNQRVPHPRNRMKGLADTDQTYTKTALVADGFSMNAALKYLPYRYFPLMVGQLDALRMENCQYRARWIVAPQDLTVAIPAFGNLNTTQRVNNGSILYGFNFTAIDGNVSNFEVNVTEICSQDTWFESTIDATALRPTPAAAQGTDLFPVLVEPRVLWSEPHPQLKITIANKASVAQRCQLLIHLAEPCGAQGVDAGALPQFPWQYPQGEGQ